MKEYIKEVNNIILDVLFEQKIDSNFDVIIGDARYIDADVKIESPIENINLKLIFPNILKGKLND